MQSNSEVIVVTGACGLVGSNLVRKLNGRLVKNVVLIDRYDEHKLRNICDLSYTGFISYDKGVDNIAAQLDRYTIRAVVHVGANTDVLVKDRAIMREANVTHAMFYLHYCSERGIPFVYASSSAVYGNGPSNHVDCTHVRQHNNYAWSKWMFDKYVLDNLHCFASRVIGLRFFNVFGMGEFHKGKNASIPYRFFEFIASTGCIELFDREIKRDYVWVEDAADVIMGLLYDKDIANGIYNVGGGNPVSHEEISELVVDAFTEMDREADIKVIPMPHDLADQFQFYTEARNMPGFISAQTKSNKEKIGKYIRQLVRMKYAPEVMASSEKL